MSSLNYLEVIPQQIILNKLSNDHYESKISLKNETEKNVLFKVFNNKKTTYSSTPNYGFITPKGSISIDIKRLEKVNKIKILFKFMNQVIDPEELNGKDKFLIIAFPIDYSVQDVKIKLIKIK